MQRGCPRGVSAAASQIAVTDRLKLRTRHAGPSLLTRNASLFRLALRGPNFLLRQPELPFSRGGMTKLTSVVTDSDLRSAQGSNSLLNLTEFVLKYSSALV